MKTDILIPELIKNNISKEFNDFQSNSKQQTLNINLNNNIDKRITNDNRTWNHTENTFNQTRGGFFRFLFDIVTLPFKIIYKITIALEKKFNIKETVRIDRERVTKSKWVKKYLRSTNDTYDFEEIY